MQSTMSDELSSALLRYLAALESEMANAADFVKEQTPLLLQEYLQYAIVLNSMISLLGIVLVAIFASKYRRALRYEDTASRVRWCLVWAAGGTLCALHTLNYMQPLLKSILAPRVFLLDYLRSLL